MKTSELLRKAADEIRRRGWHQGTYAAEGGTLESCAVCSLGAISAAALGSPVAFADDRSTPATDRAILRLAQAVAGPRAYGLHTVDWNDAEGRTVEEVLDAFERAAVAAEGEGD